MAQSEHKFFKLFRFAIVMTVGVVARLTTMGVRVRVRWLRSAIGRLFTCDSLCLRKFTVSQSSATRRRGGRHCSRFARTWPKKKKKSKKKKRKRKKYTEKKHNEKQQKKSASNDLLHQQHAAICQPRSPSQRVGFAKKDRKAGAACLCANKKRREQRERARVSRQRIKRESRESFERATVQRRFTQRGHEVVQAIPLPRLSLECTGYGVIGYRLSLPALFHDFFLLSLFSQISSFAWNRRFLLCSFFASRLPGVKMTMTRIAAAVGHLLREMPHKTTSCTDRRPVLQLSAERLHTRTASSCSCSTHIHFRDSEWSVIRKFGEQRQHAFADCGQPPIPMIMFQCGAGKFGYGSDPPVTGVVPKAPENRKFNNHHVHGMHYYQPRRCTNS